jgi:hypothetical protein
MCQVYFRCFREVFLPINKSDTLFSFWVSAGLTNKSSTLIGHLNCMRRIAAPMVGGMVSATALALIVISALFLLLRQRMIEP